MKRSFRAMVMGSMMMLLLAATPATQPTTKPTTQPTTKPATQPAWKPNFDPSSAKTLVEIVQKLPPEFTPRQYGDNPSGRDMWIRRNFAGQVVKVDGKIRKIERSEKGLRVEMIKEEIRLGRSSQPLITRAVLTKASDPRVSELKIGDNISIIGPIDSFYMQCAVKPDLSNIKDPHIISLKTAILK